MSNGSVCTAQADCAAKVQPIVEYDEVQFVGTVPISKALPSFVRAVPCVAFAVLCCAAVQLN